MKNVTYAIVINKDMAPASEYTYFKGSEDKAAVFLFNILTKNVAWPTPTRVRFIRLVNQKFDKTLADVVVDNGETLPEETWRELQEERQFCAVSAQVVAEMKSKGKWRAVSK